MIPIQNHKTNVKTVIKVPDWLTANAYLRKGWVILKILENGDFVLGLSREAKSWEELSV